MPSSNTALAAAILSDSEAQADAFTRHVANMTDVELVELKDSVIAPDLVGQVMSQALMESADDSLSAEEVSGTLQAAERLLRAGFSPFDLGGNDDSHAGGRVVEGMLEMEDEDRLAPRTIEVAIRCIALLTEYGVSLEASTTPGGSMPWHEEIAEFPDLAPWLAAHKAGQLEAAWPGVHAPSRSPRM